MLSDRGAGGASAVVAADGGGLARPGTHDVLDITLQAETLKKEFLPKARLGTRRR